MMRRVILVVAVTLIALTTLGGTALAEALAGSDHNDRLIGSNQRDAISGGGGDDLIKGLRAMDALSGGTGNDDIFAGPRDEQARDTVAAGSGGDYVKVFNHPAAKDVVDCGDGRDHVVADRKDVLSNCERVRRH